MEVNSRAYAEEFLPRESGRMRSSKDDETLYGSKSVTDMTCIITTRRSRGSVVVLAGEVDGLFKI